MSDGLTMTVPLPLHEWCKWSLADRKASGRIHPQTGTFELLHELWARLDREAVERRRQQELADQAEHRAFMQDQAERRARSEQPCAELAPKYEACMQRIRTAIADAKAAAEEAAGLIRDHVNRGLAVVEPLRVVQGDLELGLDQILRQLPDPDEDRRRTNLVELYR